MSISTIKGAGEEETLSITTGETAGNEENNEEKITELESSDVSEEVLGNGDTEIFSTIIPLMRNVCVLKTCRLVCKSWNQFACRALRKHSRVYYSVIEDYPKRTERALKIIVGNVHLGLPSPFRTFKVYATSLKEKSFRRFLKHLRETNRDFLMDLRIWPWNDNGIGVDQAELQAILTCNQKNLKIIKLLIDASDGGNIFQPEVITLPHIRTLRMMEDSFNEDKVVSLCENICRYSPLNSLKIWGYNLGDGLKNIISSLALKSIAKLWLVFQKPISRDDWDFLRASIVKILGIKKLLIYHPGASTYTDSYHEKFEVIIGHFADSLESLAGVCLPRSNNKCFPKLREIKGAPFDFESYYPVERYPLLRKATFVVACIRMYRDITDEPNLAIQEISFKTSEVTDSESLLKVLALAGRRFPNVSKFSLKSEKIKFTSEMLRSIRDSFPKLKALELRVFLRDDKTLSGLPGYHGRLRKGRLEMIPREPSLLDFSGMKELTFGPSVFITKHLFLYRLSKMSKLQYLTFYLNQAVSAIDVRDGVGHLTRINIVVLKSINPREEWVKEMERLGIMLPTVVKIKKIEVE